MSIGAMGPAGLVYAGSVRRSLAMRAQTERRSGHVINAKPEGLRTLLNSVNARGTSSGYRCSILWEENTASTDMVATDDMSVMDPITSGDTSGLISRRISSQPKPAKGVWSDRLVPHPTWRKRPRSGNAWGAGESTSVRQLALTYH